MAQIEVPTPTRVTRQSLATRPKSGGNNVNTVNVPASTSIRKADSNKGRKEEFIDFKDVGEQIIDSSRYIDENLKAGDLAKAHGEAMDLLSLCASTAKSVHRAQIEALNSEDQEYVEESEATQNHKRKRTR